MASSETQPHHRNQLPSWSRPGFGRRTSDIRTLHKDRVSSRQTSLEFSPLTERPHDFQQRAFQLEKNISFLKQQHLETLQQLHEEIERLKKENRELSFRLIMCRCGRSGKPRTSRRVRQAVQSSMSGEETDPGTPNDELRVILLEEEVRDLKKTVATERSKNARLMRVIEQKVLEQKTTDQSDSELRPSLLGATKQASSLQECESIIKQLQSSNTQQHHELVQIKADLRDVLYSHKWTPDAYLLARAYVPDREEEGAIGLPKVAVQRSKEALDRAYQRVSEGVTLPALRPRLSTNMAERQRRSQALRGRCVGRERTVL